MGAITQALVGKKRSELHLIIDDIFENARDELGDFDGAAVAKRILSHKVLIRGGKSKKHLKQI